MPEELRADADGHETTLVADIVRDLRELIRQQATLFKHEVEVTYRKTKEAARFLSMGVGFAIAGGLLFCFMLVHLVNWLFPDLPLWACYGIVATVFVAVGAGLCLAGKKKLDSARPFFEQSEE